MTGPRRWLRRCSALGFLALPLPVAAQVPGSAGALPVDVLLDIDSRLANEPPSWAPDGSAILVTMPPGPGLALIAPGGGFPRRIPVQLAGAGHFLAHHTPRWSPDGRWIAYISDRSGTAELWAWSMERGSEVELTRQGARINSFSWSPDSRTIAFGGDRNGGYDIWTVGVPDGVVRRRTEDPRYEGFPVFTPDGSHLLYVLLDSAWARHEVLDLDLESGTTIRVTVDEDFFDYGAGEKFGYPLVSPDGRRIAFPSYRSGWINYWAVRRSGGEAHPLAAAEADQSDGVWSLDGRMFAYIENHDGTHDLRVVPASGGQPRVVVKPTSGVASRPAWSPDARNIAYIFETPTSVADLMMVPAEGGRARQLTFSMPVGPTEQRISRPQRIRYESSDGITVSAYLYRPRETAAARAPAIVWTHGGPTSQYNDTFQQDVQFFVQRGYVVLLPNIRGSSGYGRGFEDANNGCWGHCDLEDVVAAADYLRRQPFVDPGRIGTTGTSYGGFMTCAAITFAPTTFQAAIAASGYCNRVAFIGEGEFRHIQQLTYEMGPFQGHEQLYHDISPYFFIGSIRTPTFLLNGRGRYPGSPQMEEFARVMQKNYKPFRYKAYEGENYYVSGRANHRQLLLDMLDFFDYYLRGKDVPLPGISYVEEKW